MIPTQTAHPWRATLRTVLAGVVALAASWGLVIEALGVDPGSPFVVVTLAVAGAITRLMAVPVINRALSRLGLGAQPRDADPALTYNPADVAPRGL